MPTHGLKRASQSQWGMGPEGEIFIDGKKLEDSLLSHKGLPEWWGPSRSFKINNCHPCPLAWWSSWRRWAINTSRPGVQTFCHSLVRYVFWVEIRDLTYHFSVQNNRLDPHFITAAKCLAVIIMVLHPSGICWGEVHFYCTCACRLCRVFSRSIKVLGIRRFQGIIFK